MIFNQHYALISLSALFPGVVVRYQPINYDPESAYYTRFFHTIWVFMGFNLFDFIGRMASGPFTQKDSIFNIIKKDQVNI